MTDPELERELRSPTLPASQGRELSPEARAELLAAARRLAIARVKESFDRRRRQIRGLHDVEEQYAALADLERREQETLARMRQAIGLAKPQKPGRKPNPRVTAAAEEAAAAIEAGMTKDRAIQEAAGRHGVPYQTIRSALRRGFK